MGVFAVETAYLEGERKPIELYAAYVLRNDNPFLLPADEFGKIESWAREVIVNKRDQRLACSPRAECVLLQGPETKRYTAKDQGLPGSY